jgi:exosome complex RNA-binding protein Rrp42 (RNase PH superfamily)
MRVEVIHSQFGLGPDVVLVGGSNDVGVTVENAPLLAGAASAGALLIVDATDDERALLAGHVQSQEDGEAAYAEAQADGRWHEGQAVQHELDEAAHVAAREEQS